MGRGRFWRGRGARVKERKMHRVSICALAVIGLMIASRPILAVEGNASRGQRLFGACAACHALDAGRNMTGPSLAGVWGRKAGTLESFSRYSPALKSSDVVWDDQTLDAWVHDPAHFIAGNTMTFRGIADAQQRADLLAFLKGATRPGA